MTTDTPTKTTTACPACPACGCKRSKTTATVMVYVCTRCECLHGRCYLGESYALVKPFMKDGELDGSKPFDLECMGSGGIRRRHGFYDPADRMILQVG